MPYFNNFYFIDYKDCFCCYIDEIVLVLSFKVNLWWEVFNYKILIGFIWDFILFKQSVLFTFFNCGN